MNESQQVLIFMPVPVQVRITKTPAPESSCVLIDIDIKAKNLWTGVRARLMELLTDQIKNGEVWPEKMTWEILEGKSITLQDGDEVTFCAEIHVR